MPDYAVLIYFDHASEQAVRKIQTEISRTSGNTFLIDNKIYPHVTLSIFSKDDYQDLALDLASFTDQLCDIKLSLTSIGIFNSTPAVLNLLPVVTDDLTGIHKKLHDLLSSRITSFNPYYERENWVPHCALAVNVAPGELTGAVETACSLFTPITCSAYSLALVECSPYREIMYWKIIPKCKAE